VLVEVVMVPVTYKIVAALKRAEHEDHYDRGTNFTPFSLKT
jgi:queuosine precursor transporter